MWNQPPPNQIVQATGIPVDHFSSRQLRQGTTANLNWRFNLTELRFLSLVILFDGKAVVGATSSGQQLQREFENQFCFEWILNQTFVTLIIFNVTIKEQGTFTCREKAQAEKRPFAFQFRSNVQVDVVGKLKVKSRNTHIYIYREREREREDITCFVSGDIMVFHRCLCDK